MSFSISGAAFNRPSLEDEAAAPKAAAKPTVGQQMKQMASSGQSVQQIADALGLPATQVASSLGIPASKQTPTGAAAALTVGLSVKA